MVNQKRQSEKKKKNLYNTGKKWLLKIPPSEAASCISTSESLFSSIFKCPVWWKFTMTTITPYCIFISRALKSCYGCDFWYFGWYVKFLWIQTTSFMDCIKLPVQHLKVAFLAVHCFLPQNKDAKYKTTKAIWSFSHMRLLLEVYFGTLSFLLVTVVFFV